MHFDITISPVFDNEQHVCCLAIFGLDITHHKHVEEALRQSEERFRTIADFAYDWEYWMGTDGRYIYVSPSCERVTGYRSEEFLYTHGLFGSIVHLDDCAQVAILLERSLYERIPLSMEFRIVARSGDVRWIGHVSQPVYTTDGTWIGVRGSNRDITSRVQAEDALRDSEERYRRIVETAEEGIWFVDADHRTTFVNRKLTAMLGYAAEEMIGKTPLDFIDPAFLSIARFYDEEVRQGVAIQCDIQCRRKDGSELWVLVNANPVFGKQGAYLGALGMYTDITERKRIERELEASTALLRATFDSTADGILVGSQDGTIVTFNRRFEELWNLPQNWHMLPSRQERLALVLDLLQKPHRFLNWLVMLDKTPEAEGSYTVALKDGRVFECYSTPYRFGESVVGRVWSYRDTTERAQAESALRESENRLQTFFNTMDDFVFVFDADGHILHSNPAVAHRLGYASEELTAMHILNLYPADMQQEAVDMVVAFIVGQAAVSEFPLVAKDGTLIPVQTRVTRGTWDNQDVIFAISRDITDLKRVEEELRQANHQLEHSVDELQQRNRDIVLLNEMGDNIQSCQTLEQAFPVIERYMQRLFPQQGGLLYLSGGDGGMQTVAAWGTAPPAIRGKIHHECWVLQHGQCLLVEGTSSKLQCHCSTASYMVEETFPYICVPMIAHGETMGILHVCHGPDHPRSVRELWEQLTVTTAGKLALELANLQLRERLRQQSIRDPLTGLFNRRYLDETLRRELQRAARHRHSVGVIMLDIDHFKQFNDTYGHDGGDTLLRAMGTLLQSYIRGEDMACRYGGEEFTLILPGANLDQTMQRAEQFRQSIKQLLVQHNGRQLRTITASLGIAVFPQHGITDETVMKAADRALYLAKSSGRDCVMIATQTR